MGRGLAPSPVRCTANGAPVIVECDEHRSSALVPGIVTKPLKVHRCLRLRQNTKGRDLVVGDLHGHRGLLEDVLDALAFDPARDRVLSVGDLIDRGPASLSTLALLDEPWFHAVLGNHELMLLNFLGFFDSRVHSRKTYASGAGEWVQAATARHARLVSRLADRVAELPLAIHVEGDAPFNVIHGDLDAIGWRQDMLLDRSAVCVHKADACATSRLKFTQALESELLSLRFDHHPVRISAAPMGALPVTYAGHSPVRHITVHDSYAFIDQGVCAPSPKRHDSVPPTVLDHRRFATWLSGVEAARRGAGAGPANHRRSLKPAAATV